MRNLSRRRKLSQTVKIIMRKPLKYIHSFLEEEKKESSAEKPKQEGGSFFQNSNKDNKDSKPEATNVTLTGLKQEAPQKTGFFPFSNDKDKDKEKDKEPTPILPESKEKEKPRENLLKLIPTTPGEVDKKPTAETNKPFELFNNSNNIGKSLFSNENSSVKDKDQSSSTPNPEKNVGLFSSPIDINSSASRPSNTEAKITPFSNGQSLASGTNSLFNNSLTPGGTGLFSTLGITGLGNINNQPKENTNVSSVINKEEPHTQNSLFGTGTANNNTNKGTGSIFGAFSGTGGLFGNTPINNNLNEGTKTTGLFGATAGNKANNEGSSLFGGSKATGGLFGNLAMPQK